MAEMDPFRLHEDADYFREALNFTAARTGFVARLIEKDYFCTLLLNYLPADDNALVFKGGTCLAKVHAGFYRLSEDLDFAIPMPATASRAQRRKRVTAMKSVVGAIPEMLPSFRIDDSFKGANDSAQYLGTVSYTSTLSGQAETIQIEVSLREPLLTDAIIGQAQTIIVDPITHTPLLPTVPLPCISHPEAFAEKFRAALTRREVAIRDFYDIYHALLAGTIRPREPDFIAMVQHKLSVPGNDAVNVSPQRLAELRLQLQSRLRPVLRQTDFDQFDLNGAFKVVSDVGMAAG